MTNWANIQVEPALVQSNGRGRAVYHQCQACDTRPLRYGTYGVETVRCGADAMHLVTRTSLMTGNTYTDHMCDRHAQGWIEAMEGK